MYIYVYTNANHKYKYINTNAHIQIQIRKYITVCGSSEACFLFLPSFFETPPKPRNVKGATASMLWYTNVNTKYTNTYTQKLQIQIQIKIHKRRLSSEV